MGNLARLKRLRIALATRLDRSPGLRTPLRFMRWLYRGVFLALAGGTFGSVVLAFLASGHLPTVRDISQVFLVRAAAQLMTTRPLPSLAVGIVLSGILVIGFIVDLLSVDPSSMRPAPALPEAARIDWGPAPDRPIFLGRERSLTLVKRWVLSEHTRMVAIIGPGGVGKTDFAANLARRYLAGHFDFILWRSLEGAPEANTVLQQCIRHFSGQHQVEIPNDPEEQVLLLLRYFREHRCLLILDNFESVLASGSNDELPSLRGPEWAAFGTLLRRTGESSHKSCLIITSREKPKQVAFLEGVISPVHTLTLSGLSDEDGRRLLENQDRRLSATPEEWHELIGHFSGNPMALSIVGRAIMRPPFTGSVARYLAQGETMPKDLQELIERQVERLSDQERDVLWWLAIEHDDRVVVDRLRQDVLLAGDGVGASLAALQSRSLVDSAGEGYVTMRPVVREYLLRRLVEQSDAEIESGQLGLLDSHALIQSQATDFVRRRQEHDLLQPLLRRLLGRHGADGMAALLRLRLQVVREHPERWRGYAAGNLINLLVHLGVDLRDADFSSIALRQADLRGVSLPGVNLADSDVSTVAFTEAFATVSAVAYSPDMASFAGGTFRGEVRIWRTSDGALQHSLQGHTDFVRSVSFSPDGTLLASGSFDQTVRLWDLKTGTCRNVLRGHTDVVWSVAFSPDGTLLASGSDDHTVRLWNVATGDCDKVLRGHSSRVWCVAFHPTGSKVASGSDDSDIRVWSIRSGRCVRRLRGYDTAVYGLAFNHGGSLLAAGRDDTRVQVWNVRARRVVQELTGHSDWIWPVAFSHDDRLLASGSADSTVRLWDLESGQALKTLTGHVGWIFSLQFSRDDRTVLTSADDRKVSIWDVQSGECIRTWLGYNDGALSIAFSPDGEVLAAGRDVNTVQLWDTMRHTQIRTLHGHTDWVCAVAFSPTGDILASAGEDFTVRLWQLPDGSSSTALIGHANRVSTLAFTPDGTVLASGSDDRSIRLWRVPTGASIRSLDGHEDEVYSVAFHPNGDLLASGGADETIRLWDLSRDTPPIVLRGHTSDVYAVAFSPDGNALASACADGTVRIWDINTYECKAMLAAHSGAVSSLAFSADGTRFATGGKDRTVKVWDASTYMCWAVLEGHTQVVNTVTFSPNGRLLASGSDDSTIRIWSGDTFERLGVLAVERPYEGMRIAGIRGLSPAQVNELKVLGAVDV